MQVPGPFARIASAALLCSLTAISAPAGGLPGRQAALPLPFAANAGQFPAEACFHVASPGPAILFGEEGLVLRQGGGRGLPPIELHVMLVGAEPEALEAGMSLKGVVNYYFGNEPSRWRTGVPTHEAVVYRSAWPGIDVEYSGRSGRLKSEVRVRPGGRVENVRFRYEGAVALSIREDGALIVQTFAGDLVEEAPVAWQVVDDRKEPVACRFRLLGPLEVGFGVGRFDPSRELVLDPVLNFSTFLGGSGDDAATAVSGGPVRQKTRVWGNTTSLDFPVLFAAQEDSAGGSDIFVLELDPSGEQFLWASYVGGSGDDVLSDGVQAGLLGWTNSPDFPMPEGESYGPRGGPSDALMLSVGSQGRLGWSMIIGGTGADELLGADDGWAVGRTTSPDFPVAAGTLNGPSDAFVLSFLRVSGEPRWELTWATYLGGSGHDEAHAVMHQFVPSTSPYEGLVLVGGRTESPDFPVSPTALDTTFDGPSDGFLARYTRTEISQHRDRLDLSSATFFGGSGEDSVLSLQKGETELEEFVDLAGWTSSPDLPVARAWQSSLGGGRDVFHGLLDFDFQEVVTLSYLGGSGDEHLSSGRVSAAGATLAGWTDSPDLPMLDAWQAAPGGGEDGFYAELLLQPEGYTLLRSSYHGGSGDDRILSFAGALEDGRCLMLAGSTSSTDFPRVLAAQPDYGGGDTDAFVTRICNQDLPASGEWSLGDIIERLDRIEQAVEMEEAKLDILQGDVEDQGVALEAVEAKLDAPPSHADLQADIRGNGVALAMIESKLDGFPDVGEALEALEVKADDLRSVVDEALARRDEERLVWIEQLLHAKQCIPTLWLPERNEGWLEVAAAHVADLIQRAEDSGDDRPNLGVARMRLGEALAALDEGAPMRACQKLSDSLRALTSP